MIFKQKRKIIKGDYNILSVFKNRSFIWKLFRIQSILDRQFILYCLVIIGVSNNRTISSNYFLRLIIGYQKRFIHIKKSYNSGSPKYHSYINSLILNGKL